MSRAGRRARRERLIAAGLWQPSSVLDGEIRQQQDARARVLIAERDEWIREAGLLGWQREQNRRRAERTARLRNRRRNGYDRPGNDRAVSAV